MAANLSEAELMVHLRSVGTLLKAMNLQTSVGVIEEIESEISGNADFSRLMTLQKVPDFY